MILLVPVSPEVPKRHRPRLWPGLVLVLFLGIAYLETHSILESDLVYVENLESLAPDDNLSDFMRRPEASEYLRKRPLLKIAPSRGSWDIRRLVSANFVHGSAAHVLLNLIGVFAGARICATFLSFPLIIGIFIIGGSLGLFASLFTSSELSTYIPHVGSSAGLFALMGTYYIYNFRFRTRYFFWFPSRFGLISLRTSWFFFLDVILLEIVLSAAQLFPGRIDSIDHIAHVVGFGSGMCLAVMIRFIQNWPSFLQTRAEQLFLANAPRSSNPDPLLAQFEKWIELLEINPYNDQVKFRVYGILYTESDRLSDSQIESAFRFISPTFIRLHTADVGAVLHELLSKRRLIPVAWLRTTPYDSVIRLAKSLTVPPEEQHLLFRFIAMYRHAHPEGGDLERKLELLMQKLSGLIPSEEVKKAMLELRGGTPSPADKTSSASTTPRTNSSDGGRQVS